MLPRRVIIGLLLWMVHAPVAYLQTPASAVPQVQVKPAALTISELRAKVDELLNAHVTVNDFSGTIMLAREGQSLVTKGYGYANAEWKIPNTATTKFRIGSITKQFTSMVVMQLRERGQIKLEDSVCRYLLPCPEAWTPVTIHHLLTHTSGIPSYTDLPEWRAANMTPKTTSQILGLVRDRPLGWAPGEKYAYNNSGYFILGVVIEKITGTKYEDVVQEMILKPLFMTSTGYDWPRTILPERASGYTGKGNQRRNADAIDMQQPFAAGGLYSTVEDLLKWDQALYTDKLLPSTAREIMWTPFKENYAFGWIVLPPAAGVFGGYRRIMHTGGINGFSSVIVRLVDAKMTFIVLANNDTAPSTAIAREMAAIYYGTPYTIPSAARTPMRSRLTD